MREVWSIVCNEGDTVGARSVASLARALTTHGKRVLVLELATFCPTLDFAFDVAERVVYTLSDVGRISGHDVFLQPAPCGCRGVKPENIMFVPCSVGEELDDPSRIRDLLHAANADVTLILASPAHASLARAVSDGVLLMTRTDAPLLRCAAAVASSAEFDGLVLCDFVPTRDKIKKMPSLLDIADMTTLPVFAVLPRESGFEMASAAGKDFRAAIGNLTERLLGKQIPLLRGIRIEGMRKRKFFERI